MFGGMRSYIFWSLPFRRETSEGGSKGGLRLRLIMVVGIDHQIIRLCNILTTLNEALVGEVHRAKFGLIGFRYNSGKYDEIFLLVNNRLE